MVLSVTICLIKLCEINFIHVAHLFCWEDDYKYLCATCPSYETTYKSCNSLWQLILPWGHRFYFIVLFLKMHICLNAKLYANKFSTRFLPGSLRASPPPHTPPPAPPAPNWIKFHFFVISPSLFRLHVWPDSEVECNNLWILPILWHGQLCRHCLKEVVLVWLCWVQMEGN